MIKANQLSMKYILRNTLFKHNPKLIFSRAEYPLQHFSKIAFKQFRTMNKNNKNDDIPNANEKSNSNKFHSNNPFEENYSQKESSDQSTSSNHDKVKSKCTEYYTPKQTLIFTNGILPLIDTTKSRMLKAFLFRKYLTYFILAMSGVYVLYELYQLLTCINKKVITLSTLGFIIAIIFLFLSLKKVLILKFNINRVVIQFNLKEDGKNIEIETLTKQKFIINVQQLAQTKPENILKFHSQSPELVNKVYPIRVEKGEHKGFLFIPLDIDMNKEIINAIMSGSFIDVKKSIKSKETVIMENQI